MLDRIDIKNILCSFVIGALIGLFSQIAVNAALDIKVLLISVLISGLFGLFIGAVIEFIMSLLPIKIAKPSTYFIISNITALLITFVVILLLFFYGVEDFDATDLSIVLIIAFVIIFAANIIDYTRYKKANKKLVEYKEKNKSK
jgi:hypothetical protein